MTIDWSSERVLLTGGRGFLGSYVTEVLAARGCTSVLCPTRQEYDLVRGKDVERVIADGRPTMVIHLAAVVGGIGANRASPGTFFYENLMMGVQLIEEARKAGVRKVVAIGTVCGYPKFAPTPFREEDLWNGYPEETNAPYGLAKKMLLVQAQAYRQEYGFNTIFLVPVNLYGPRDDFDPATSHVIPALIRKCHEALAEGRDEILCWGDGSPTREFLHAADAAEGIVRAAEAYDGPEPINLGTGREISIRDLVDLIAGEVGFRGRIRWDTSFPNGQPRRCLDTSRAERLLGWRARVPLARGIRETVQWYRSTQE